MLKSNGLNFDNMSSLAVHSTNVNFGIHKSNKKLEYFFSPLAAGKKYILHIIYRQLIIWS